MNCVVLLMRLMLLRIASTCSWLAWISWGDSAPVLAAWLVRLCTCSSSEETSLSAPSAVFTTLPAGGVVDRLVDAGDLALELLAGDQAGGVVLAGIDLQARCSGAAGVARIALVLAESVNAPGAN